MPRDRDPQLHEPVVLQDIFVTRLAKVERVGNASRLIFAVPQDGQSVAVAKLVVQDEDLAAIALQIAEVIHRRRR